MKRIKRLVFIILLFIPFIVYGKVTYNENEIKNITNNYTPKISKEYNLEYGKYFDSDIDDLKIITKEEFEATKKGKGVSYLISSLEYWAKDKYKISYNATQVTNDNDKSGVRVTEYAKSDIKASGEGTLSSPWTLGTDIIKIEIYSYDSSKLVFNDSDYIIDYTSTTNNDTYIFSYSIKDSKYMAISSNSTNYLFDKPTVCNNAVMEILGNNQMKITFEKNSDKDIRCYVGVGYNKVNVTYNPNGGSITSGTSPQEKEVGKKYGSFPTVKRTGYTNNAWKTSKGDVVTSESTIEIGQDHEVIAQWNPNTYVVTYNPNGGSVSQTTGNQTYDSNYSELPTPTRTGYTFTGWFLEKKYGETQVTTSTKVTIDSNHKLIAHWTANTYNVTYNPNGGSVSPASGIQTYDQNYANLPTPTYYSISDTKYFDGWYTSSIGGILVNENTLMKTASDHTLYAHWVDDCIITWNASNLTYINGRRPPVTSILGTSNSFDGRACATVTVKINYESHFRCNNDPDCWGGQYEGFYIELLDQNNTLLKREGSTEIRQGMKRWETEHTLSFMDLNVSQLSNVHLVIKGGADCTGVYTQKYGFFNTTYAPSDFPSSRVVGNNRIYYNDSTGWFVTRNGTMNDVNSFFSTTRRWENIWKKY